MAGLFGGTVLTPGPISDEGLQTYLKSVAHFKEETRKAGVDVVASAQTGIDGPAFGVRVVVRAYPGIELEPCQRSELEHGVRGRAAGEGVAHVRDAE